MNSRPRLWANVLLLTVALVALSGCQRSKDQITGREPSESPVGGIAVAPVGASPTTEPGAITVGVESPTPVTDTGLGTAPTAAPGIDTTTLATATPVPVDPNALLTPTVPAGAAPVDATVTAPAVTTPDAGTGTGTGAGPIVQVTQEAGASGDPSIATGGGIGQGSGTDTGGTAVQPTALPPTPVLPPESTVVTVQVEPTAVAPGTDPTTAGADPNAVGTESGELTYTVQRGDNLTQIATRFNTTIDELTRLNPGLSRNFITVGQVLRLPGAGSQSGGQSGGQTQGTTPTEASVYTVVAGDTLSAIARRYNTTVEALATANNLRVNAPIYVGQQIRIPGQGNQGTTPAQPGVSTPTAAAGTTGSGRVHVVGAGENLFRIALRYNTTVEAIRAANGLSSNVIYTGQNLRIP